MTCLSAYTCTDKFPNVYRQKSEKAFLGGGGQLRPPPPPLATLVLKIHLIIGIVNFLQFHQIGNTSHIMFSV